VQYTSNNQANILKTIKDNKAYFQHQLYAEMVRQLFNDDLYYKILLEKDDMMSQIK
jgi:hypothetical protein